MVFWVRIGWFSQFGRDLSHVMPTPIFVSVHPICVTHGHYKLKRPF